MEQPVLEGEARGAGELRGRARLHAVARVARGAARHESDDARGEGAEPVGHRGRGRVDDAQAVVAGVGDVEQPVLVDGDGSRVAEARVGQRGDAVAVVAPLPARARHERDVARGDAPSRQRHRRRADVDDAHAVVAGVSDEEQPAAVIGEARRRVELRRHRRPTVTAVPGVGVAGHAAAARDGGDGACRGCSPWRRPASATKVGDANPVVAGVGDVQLAGVAEREAGGAVQARGGGEGAVAAQARGARAGDREDESPPSAAR